MDNIQRIAKDGVDYALFVRGRPKVDPIRFFTEQNDHMQLGVMERPAGYAVKPHVHPRQEKTIDTVTEFLYVESGKIKVEVFGEDWEQLAEEVFEPGDFLIFFRGGHAVTMLEASRVIEVKQGPYIGDTNAKVFRPNA